MLNETNPVKRLQVESNPPRCTFSKMYEIKIIEHNNLATKCQQYVDSHRKVCDLMEMWDDNLAVDTRAFEQAMLRRMQAAEELRKMLMDAQFELS